MEIYRHSTDNTVAFEAPLKDSVVTATASLDDGPEIPLVVIATPDSRIRTAKIPYVPNDGTIKVLWSFETDTFDGTQSVSIEDTYSVVTPILTNLEIREIHPSATLDEISRVEKAVRHVINAYTGQTFGLFVGTKTVVGGGGSVLILPAKLNELVSINGFHGANDRPVTDYYLVHPDGMALRYFQWGVPPVKADYFGLHYTTNGVIHNPNDVRVGRFTKDAHFNIEGVWGWKEVPTQVREAAMLLVNDYACADIAYRDRFLTSMTAADWRIQFNSLAWTGTGNARADELLRDYKAFGGKVI